MNDIPTMPAALDELKAAVRAFAALHTQGQAAPQAQPQAEQEAVQQPVASRMSPFNAVARAMELASLLAGSVGQNDVQASNAYAARLRTHLVDHIYPAQLQAAAGLSEAEREADAFLADVRAELIRARAKFPGDRIMTIALAEEFGELCKAVLDEPSANVRKEAVQTAVMACRVAVDGDGSVDAWRRERGLDPLTAAALSAQPAAPEQQGGRDA